MCEFLCLCVSVLWCVCVGGWVSGRRGCASIEAVDGLTWQEENELRSREATAWKVLPPDTRLQFIAAWRPRFGSGLDDGEMGDDEAIEGRSLTDAQSPWERALGCTEWPLRPGLIQDCLGSLTRQTGRSKRLRGCTHGGGVAGRYREHCRDKMAERCLVRDKQAVPAGRIQLQAACWQIHPGLCAMSDAGIYEKALAVAKHVEKFFTKAHKHKFYMLQGVNETTVVWECYIFFAHGRARRRNVPVTHAFLRLAHSQGLLMPMQAAPEVLNYINPWEIARELLLKEGELLCSTVLSLVRTSGIWELAVEQPLAEEVWPTVVAAATRAATTADPDDAALARLKEAEKASVKRPPRRNEIVMRAGRLPAARADPIVPPPAHPELGPVRIVSGNEASSGGSESLPESDNIGGSSQGRGIGGGSDSPARSGYPLPHGSRAQ